MRAGLSNAVVGGGYTIQALAGAVTPVVLTAKLVSD